jgi:hypothetical protein
MAIADLARAESAPYLDVLDDASTSEASVRLEVHDASRLEWSISIPLPDRAPLKYAIDVELEIPSNALARHQPWDQLQSFTRLDGPQLGASSRGDPVTIDALRRGTLALAQKLARASDGFTRHCVLAGSLFAPAPRLDLEDGLILWLEAARQTVIEARARLCRHHASDAIEVARERELVDEYVSVRHLEVLAAAERSLAHLLESKSAHVPAMRPAIARAEEAVARALAAEIEHRAAHGYVRADPDAPELLERYLDRASQLKKHFQEVLFLEPETVHVAERIHHWAAAFAALLASTWSFFLQMWLAGRAPTTGTRVGSGLVLLAALAGVVYVAKDRIKEVGRNWISGKVRRFYAERVARYRAPARRLPKRDVIAAARESCSQSVSASPDPLNPHSGASVLASIVKYTHRGTVWPRVELARQGVSRIKHVFRYDLSPLFARLDDAVKPVPVLDPETRKVRFAAAPRCYRVPVRVRVRCGATRKEEVATLVLTKRGLDRLERAEDGEARALDLF